MGKATQEDSPTSSIMKDFPGASFQDTAETACTSHDRFVHFLRTGTVSCGGLQTSILADFDSDIGKHEMRVLGLIGKLLSCPWITIFYTSPEEQVSHTQGITIVKGVLETTKEYLAKPECVLTTKTDFFGNVLDESDAMLQKLHVCEDGEGVSDSCRHCPGATI